MNSLSGARVGVPDPPASAGGLTSPPVLFTFLIAPVSRFHHVSYRRFYALWRNMIPGSFRAPFLSLVACLSKHLRCGAASVALFRPSKIMPPSVCPGTMCEVRARARRLSLSLSAARRLTSKIVCKCRDPVGPAGHR